VAATQVGSVSDVPNTGDETLRDEAFAGLALVQGPIVSVSDPEVYEDSAIRDLLIDPAPLDSLARLSNGSMAPVDFGVAETTEAGDPFAEDFDLVWAELESL
jgi:hypothetical protein